MSIVDIGLTILIIGLLGFLILYSTLTAYIMAVDRSWSKNMCNPLIMPFISLVGQDATKNFMRCVRTVTSKNVKDALSPVTSSINDMSNSIGYINESVNNAQTDIQSMRNNMIATVEGIYAVILNLLIATQRSLIWIKEVINKTVGVLTALSYSMTGGILVGKGIIEGPMTDLVNEISTVV